MATYAEENYLKAIFKLGGKHQKPVSTNALAAEMNTRASSVTDMMKKLSGKKWISYKKYQGATLTKKGKQIALSVVRKHRLWEVFLVNKLHFAWDEIHEIAEQLEHIQSETLIQRLDQFLGHPNQDPHGDPIPDKDGNISPADGETLSNLTPGNYASVLSVSNHTPEFLKYIDSIKLTPGTIFRVIKQYDYDYSFVLEVQGKELLLSEQVAEQIIVQKHSK